MLWKGPTSHGAVSTVKKWLLTLKKWLPYERYRRLYYDACLFFFIDFLILWFLLPFAQIIGWTYTWQWNIAPSFSFYFFCNKGVDFDAVLLVWAFLSLASLFPLLKEKFTTRSWCDTIVSEMTGLLNLLLFKEGLLWMCGFQSDMLMCNR